jgi:hypothetical protein
MLVYWDPAPLNCVCNIEHLIIPSSFLIKTEGMRVSLITFSCLNRPHITYVVADLLSIVQSTTNVASSHNVVHDTVHIGRLIHSGISTSVYFQYKLNVKMTQAVYDVTQCLWANSQDLSWCSEHSVFLSWAVSFQSLISHGVNKKSFLMFLLVCCHYCHSCGELLQG